MQRQADTYIYDGSALDPSATFASQGHAVINQVKNQSSYSFSLAHVDRFGNQTLFINLYPNTTVGWPFTGLEVEGGWTAEFIGDLVQSPLNLVVWVSWHKP
jgi:hypothetical protein